MRGDDFARPSDEMDRLRGRLRRLLDDMFPEPGEAPAQTGWTPRADIYATTAGLRIEVEACGVPRENLEVSVDGDTVWVRGARVREPARPQERYYQVERPAGQFARAFSLGFPPARIEADLVDGVLTVSVMR